MPSFPVITSDNCSEAVRIIEAALVYWDASKGDCGTVTQASMIASINFNKVCNPANIRAVLALLAAKQEEVDKMRADNERLQIAADRYGWLRGWGVSVERGGQVYTEDALDILVDGNIRLDASLSPIQGAGGE